MTASRGCGRRRAACWTVVGFRDLSPVARALVARRREVPSDPRGVAEPRASGWRNSLRRSRAPARAASRRRRRVAASLRAAVSAVNTVGRARSSGMGAPDHPPYREPHLRVVYPLVEARPAAPRVRGARPQRAAAPKSWRRVAMQYRTPSRRGPSPRRRRWPPQFQGRVAGLLGALAPPGLCRRWAVNQ